MSKSLKTIRPSSIFQTCLDGTSVIASATVKTTSGLATQHRDHKHSHTTPRCTQPKSPNGKAERACTRPQTTEGRGAHKESVKPMCLTRRPRSGPSHFTHIDSPSFTWNPVVAESKTVKQSAEHEMRQDSELRKCPKTCEDLSDDKCSRTRVAKCRLASPMQQALQLAAYQGEDLSRQTSSEPQRQRKQVRCQQVCKIDRQACAPHADPKAKPRRPPWPDTRHGPRAVTPHRPGNAAVDYAIIMLSNLVCS